MLREFLSVGHDGERQGVGVLRSAFSLHRFNFMPSRFLCEQIFKVAHYLNLEPSRHLPNLAVWFRANEQDKFKHTKNRTLTINFFIFSILTVLLFWLRRATFLIMTASPIHRKPVAILLRQFHPLLSWGLDNL